MEKIKRFFECLIPVTVCNLKCDYCYVIQQNRRTMQLSKLHYSTDWMVKCLTKKRLGGTCFFSICGAGETLMQPEVVDIVVGLLAEGHFVNITTNGTQTNKIREILKKSNNIEHLHFSFSMHYLELKKRHLIDVFFDNINMVRGAGASFLLQLNLYDGYLPYLDEIKKICIERVGAFPQVPLTRNENNGMHIHSSLSKEDYYKKGEEFDSPLFRFTYENFDVKRHEFCYAGDWSALLNLETGIMTQCYANNNNPQNIFENPNNPIQFKPIGSNCNNCYCVNSSHFMSLGVIPSFKAPTYAELRNRETVCGQEWYTEEMKCFLNSKLEESNKKYSYVGEKIIDFFNKHSFKKVKTKIYHFSSAYKRIINKRAYVIGTPLYSNIGDSAIALAEKQFVQDCRLDKDSVLEITHDEYWNHRKAYRALIKKQSLICLVGGGNIGNQWPAEEQFHQTVMTDFKSNPMIMFPQTIHFVGEDKQKDIDKSQEVYSKCNNLTLVAREKTSKSIMKELYPQTEVLLTPDIVLSTTMDQYGVKKQKRSNGVMFCVRSDAEKSVDNSAWERLEKDFNDLGIEYFKTDMYSDKPVTKENRAERVREKMQEFCGARLVVTDRLHGMIFAALTGTPCIVFSNYNHKVKGTYDFISYLPYIKYAETVDQAESYIPDLLEMQNCEYDNEPLKPYFDELKKKILELTNNA